MNPFVDIVVSCEPLRLHAPIIAGTTRDAIILQSDPRKKDAPPAKVALDLRTGERLPGLPSGYAPIEAPCPTLDGGAELRVVKRTSEAGRPKSAAIKDVELRIPSGETFVLASCDDVQAFVAGRICGAIHSEPLRAVTEGPGPRRDTRRLTMTLARPAGPVVAFPLPWWVVAFDENASRLGPWRLAVCMRARVLVILGWDAYWFSLDTLEQLLAEITHGAPVTLRSVHPPTERRGLLALYARAKVLVDQASPDPMHELVELLGLSREDVERDGARLVLTERAAAALERALAEPARAP